ncbi:hypothetical protein M798_14205 [Brucella melitensis ADMAS-G1]|nr:hypothetical protein M798_14205 [Brucella melitensis ADMAS-G1]
MVDYADDVDGVILEDDEQATIASLRKRMQKSADIAIWHSIRGALRQL